MTDPFGRDTKSQWLGSRIVATVPEKIDPRITVGFESSRFPHGIELLNDDKTPMNFVVDALMKHVQLDRSVATQAMLAVHTKGRAVIAVYSHDAAARISKLISAEAAHSGHPLVCRAANA